MERVPEGSRLARQREISPLQGMGCPQVLLARVSGLPPPTRGILLPQWEEVMRRWGLVPNLLSAAFLLSACGVLKPPISTVIVPETHLVTVEVTRVVRETVVVTPSPPLVWSLGIAQGPLLGIPRTWHTATRLNDGRFLLVGGSNGMDGHYALVEIYDPANGLLTPAASLHTPRSGHSATLLQDNRVLIVGGYNYQQQWLQDTEVYDPSTDTWTVVPPIYPHGVGHTATLLRDGRVLVVGGCIGSSICTDRVEIFDPHTNSWTETTHLTDYRASHTAVLLDDGRVLVAGGGGPYGNPTDGDALLFDPLTNQWTATGSMVQPRTQAQMLKLLDGRVMVVGGLIVSAYPVALASTEIFDPASSTWTSAASLAQPRHAFTLGLLPDGQLMAVGGAHEYDYPVNYPDSHPWTASSFVRKIETYDPRSDRWRVAGELPQPVTYGAAVFLPDGRLWLTGGGAGHALAPAWAETWLISP